MEYVSTLGTARPASLREAVIRGMAPDGGLYMPSTIRRLPKAFFSNIGAMDLHDVAYVVADMLFGDDIDSHLLKMLVADSLNFEVPTRKVADNRYVIELFHGPSSSWKDIGSRFMARLVDHYRPNDVTGSILVAATGDTGSAVSLGFHGIKGIEVYVLFPASRLHHPSTAHFTTLGGNVHPIAVNGDIDDCVELVKRAMVDAELYRRCNLVTSNSINVARLLPQTFSYFHAYACLQRMTGGRHGDVVMSVPAANLGDLTAGIIAKRMGLPVKRLVAAQNHNGVFAEYMSTGKLTTRDATRSVAPILSVGDPTNFPRIKWLYGSSVERMRDDIEAHAINDPVIVATIKDAYEKHGYLLDPHSATAWRAMELSLRPGETGLTLATLSPAMSAASIMELTGIKVPIPGQLRELFKKQRSCERIAPRFDALKRYLLNHASKKVL